MLTPKPMLIAFLTVSVMFFTYLQDITVAQVTNEAVSISDFLTSVDISKDGSTIVSAGDSIRIYQASSGRLLHRIKLKKYLRTIECSPTDADVFVTAGEDSIIRFWSLEKAKQIRAF